jgi:hypothetical protein
MKKRTNIILLLVGVTMLFSCEDFLGKNPDNRTRIDSPEAASELLVSAYPNAMYQGFTEAMSDNVGDKGLGQYIAEYISNNEAYFWKDDSNEEYDSPTYYWSKSYNAIAHANEVLKAISEAPDKAAYNAQKGEALACRAYAHFMLVNIFAKHYNPATCATDLGVPYVDEPENVVFKKYTRASVKEVYERIEADLTEALELVRDESYTVPKYHFTKAALNAFASRFYLYTGNWDKVIEHANKVLGTNPSSVLRDWNGKYQGYTPEELWAQYSKGEEPANILLIRGYTYWPSGLVVFRYSLSADKIMELFDKQGNSAPYFDLSFSDKILYAASDQQLGFIPKYPRRLELLTANASMGYPNSIIPTFTMEEVLFNRMEASVMKVDYASALTDLDSYFKKRNKVYDPNNKMTEQRISELYATYKAPALAPFYSISERQKLYIWYLLDLRRREFVHEGMRWFDIKRFNFEITHNVVNGANIKLPKDDPRRAIQIPAQAIAVGLKANPR